MLLPSAFGSNSIINKLQLYRNARRNFERIEGAGAFRAMSGKRFKIDGNRSQSHPQPRFIRTTCRIRFRDLLERRSLSTPPVIHYILFVSRSRVLQCVLRLLIIDSDTALPA